MRLCSLQAAAPLSPLPAAPSPRPRALTRRRRADVFTVPKEEGVMIAPSKMHKATADIFRALGMPSDDADLSADTLMFADTRGIDSHGVSNMMKAYVHWLQRYPKVGSVNPNWEMKIERETAAIATVDCDNGLGLCVGPKAMDLAIEKAKACGVGWVVVNNGAPPPNPAAPPQPSLSRAAALQGGTTAPAPRTRRERWSRTASVSP